MLNAQVINVYDVPYPIQTRNICNHHLFIGGYVGGGKNAEIWYTSIYHHPRNSIPILFKYHQSTFRV